MLDLIGYWTAVSVITFVLLFWVLGVVPFILKKYGLITFSGDLRDKFCEWCVKKERLRYHNWFIIFNKLRVHETILVLGSFMSAVILLLILVNVDSAGNTIVGFVHDLATDAIPFFTFVGSIVLVFIVMVYAGRFIEKMFNTVTEIKEKLDATTKKGDGS